MLTINQPLLNQMLNHLRECYPLEGCGLLAGDDQGRVTAVYPVKNILQSPTAYEMDPHQQIEAMVAIETEGWQLSAIFHSHPQGPEVPSATDISLAFYPDTLTLIVSLVSLTKPVIRAFKITGHNVTEQTVMVV